MLFPEVQLTHLMVAYTLLKYEFRNVAPKYGKVDTRKGIEGNKLNVRY